MSRTRTSIALAALLTFALAASPATSTRAGQVARNPQPDAARLIDDAAAGDIAALEAALPSMRDPAGAALLRARIAASRLDGAKAERALAAYFAMRDRDPRRQAIAWSIRADVAFNLGDYAGSSSAIEQWLALPASARRGKEGETMTQALGIARILAGAPRQARVGGRPGTIPTHRDKAGLVLGATTINGVMQDAVLDTGANLSVVSASTAKKLGLRMLEGAASVGSTSADNVPTRLAIADRLSIAGVDLANVVFLVLADSQLDFPVPGGYNIEAILGFPVFRALERIRFDRAGGFAAGEAAGPAGTADNLRVAGSDLYVLSQVNGADAALHLDTGATHSVLTARFAQAHAPLLAGMAPGKRQVAGAGGAVITQATVHWKPVTLAVDGEKLALPEIVVATDSAGVSDENRLGVLGQDVLGAFQSYTIDFGTMSFTLGARAPAPG